MLVLLIIIKTNRIGQIVFFSFQVFTQITPSIAESIKIKVEFIHHLALK